MYPDKQKRGCAVIITVKNDAAALERTLLALQQQTRPPDEGVLAVAESQDGTKKVALAFAKKHPHWSVIPVASATRSLGRNLAVQATKQPLLAFTDAGCLPDKAWLENLLRPFSDPDCQVVSGLTLVQNDSPLAEAQGAFVLVPPEKIETHPLPATRNMAMRRSTFLQHKGFLAKLNFAEDFEFSRRLHRAGVLSVFAPEAIVFWEAPATPSRFFQMIYRLTLGDMQAGTWRKGHLTMWLRYLGFIALLAGLQTAGQNWRLSFLVTVFVYGCYLALKMLRFRFTRRASFFWAILLQVLADGAVLRGTLLGMLQRSRKKEV